MTQLTDAGQKVFNARYALRDEQGHICETFEQAVSRLARVAASAEKETQPYWEEKFASIIGDLLFVPSTPIWANMGKPDRPWQPSACFVLAVEDTLYSMYETLLSTALVFKSGGGVGYNFSTIRPRGSLVQSTKGKASGVVELIKLYNASSNMVMQGGVRRGASMGILNIDHPEIMNFIHAKLDGGLTNFNLSVGVTDAFMQALEQGEDWPLIFNGEVHDVLPAAVLWQSIVQSAHACGDPGIIFLDTIQKANPLPHKQLNCTNPCGEQPLFPGESCLLGSVNLARLIAEDGRINRALFKDTVSIAVRFLDNLIDVAEYPFPLIAEATRATRKIGLGFTGLADALIKAGLPYDSAEGRKYAGEIIELMQQSANDTSRALAEEKGCFPEWENSKFHPAEKIRNGTCVTIAPTGSVTTMAGCEGYGIEPIFAVAYKKSTNVAGDFEVFSPLFLEACQLYGVSNSILEEVARRGTCQGIKEIPVEIARIFKGAQDIAPADHILMQAEIQKHVDNAVSKTINLPGAATTEDIETCYRMAYSLGLKGITVFRDGCKEGTVTVGRQEDAPEKFVLRRGEILPRPVSAHGMTHRLDTGCGKLYLTVNYQPDSGEILETFITTGSDGGCLVYTEATSRLISLAIRGGISLEEIVEQLQGTHSCPSYMLAKGKGKNLSQGKSCASAIAYKIAEIKAELKKQFSDYNGAGEILVDDTLLCECGEKLERAEGCLICRSCGLSKC
ncbi:Ribonucleoside-diphosphate reductase NrdZ [Pelotomaculum sp. FP]|uniref:adenosylcobalamin-dependent ribonucleoside-diphosphate reductase n=1 Tax=Pelotomaculum sp. FP TaxID=261474 RepID=UPI001064A701|nr:adenosylcobalamin-dependent ribonucleoside-diphosphate reductase [Pelotomaculum sp. FP]TEB15264.1 Ribonucleoside-diphosphate reductase NrdZ [Pelotomaculum sp. FP]